MSDDDKIPSEEAKTFNDSDFGPENGVGQVHYIHNIEDLIEVPSIWRKFTIWSEKLGAESIGIQRLPEAARDPNLRPWSKSQLNLFHSITSQKKALAFL